MPCSNELCSQATICVQASEIQTVIKTNFSTKSKRTLQTIKILSILCIVNIQIQVNHVRTQNSCIKLNSNSKHHFSWHGFAWSQHIHLRQTCSKQTGTVNCYYNDNSHYKQKNFKYVVLHNTQICRSSHATIIKIFLKSRGIFSCADDKTLKMAETSTVNQVTTCYVLMLTADALEVCMGMGVPMGMGFPWE